MANAMLRARGLTKKYGEFTALDKVSLTLREGDVFGLVGRNGAGKSTFFKCVMGLAAITSGQIEIAGKRKFLDSARKKIGFMMNPAFFPYLSPYENLEYQCYVKGVKNRGEINKLLKIVQLEGIKKSFKHFSLGMKQRLGLAAAMLGSPPIIVLDEPINGLDPQGILDIRDIIKTENTQNGTTFIISSHILSELDLVANCYGFIEKGKLLKEISHEELHKQTKKSLSIEVDNPRKAAQILKKKLGINTMSIVERKITFESLFLEPNIIAKALVSEGIELMKLSPEETTLEEYFINLVGGNE